MLSVHLLSPNARIKDDSLGKTDVKLNRRQQALAKWGLNFVIEEYLPRKLSEAKKFLP